MNPDISVRVGGKKLLSINYIQFFLQTESVTAHHKSDTVTVCKLMGEKGWKGFDDFLSEAVSTPPTE